MCDDKKYIITVKNKNGVVVEELLLFSEHVAKKYIKNYSVYEKIFGWKYTFEEK